MEHVRNLFGKKAALPKRKRPSERAELLEFFIPYLKEEWDEKKYGKLTFSRLNWKLQNLKNPDLYYLKSGFIDRLRRNNRNTAVRWFWWSLNPDKHTDV